MRIGPPVKYTVDKCIFSFCAADTVRRNLGLSTDFCRKEPYDKLEKALLSGLPNEVDFAINVCTLLSNEGKHSLNVTKSPKLIEILLAHVGIFRDGAGSLFTLHHEGWRPRTKRNFERVSGHFDTYIHKCFYKMRKQTFTVHR